jgi:Ca-activated chloride channel homolog
MTWLRSLGLPEYVFIGCYLLFYTLYIIRMIKIAGKMKSSIKPVFFKFFVRSTYFSLLLIALLGPSFGNIKKQIKSARKDIYAVVDLSISMNASDIQPSRLKTAKESLKKMVDILDSDRIGLIIFSSSAFVHTPLTQDQNALNLFIETLNTDLIAQSGSNISSGIELALEQHLKSDSRNNNKIIVLITDGEDFSDNASEVVSKINENNLHLFLLGIGTGEGSKIPIGGTFKKDKQGDFVITKLNREYLKEIIGNIDGRYFEINKNSNELETMINAIQKIEGAVNDVYEADVSANKYLYFLLFALFFIIIDVLITVRTVKI